MTIRARCLTDLPAVEC